MQTVPRTWTRRVGLAAPAVVWVYLLVLSPCSMLCVHNFVVNVGGFMKMKLKRLGSPRADSSH